MEWCGTGRGQNRARRIASADELDSQGHHVINLPRVEKRVKTVTDVEPLEQSQCLLLRLPVELRSIIWRLVLGDHIIPVRANLYNTDKKPPRRLLAGSWQWVPHSLKINPLDVYNRSWRGNGLLDPLRSAQVRLASNLTPSFPLAVLRTCRRIHDEVRNVFYSSNTFYLQGITVFRLLPHLLPVESVRSMRIVHLNLRPGLTLTDQQLWLELFNQVNTSMPGLDRLTIEIGTWTWECDDDHISWIKHSPDSAYAAQIEQALREALSGKVSIRHITLVFGWQEPSRNEPHISSGSFTSPNTTCVVRREDDRPPVSWVSDTGIEDGLRLISGEDETIPYSRAQYALMHKTQPATEPQNNPTFLETYIDTNNFHEPKDSVRFHRLRRRDHFIGELKSAAFCAEKATKVNY